MAVNNYRSADNVVCGEALVIEGKPGITFVSKKGKQVACMVRMRLAGWIVVVPCFGEVIRTVTVLVDVHSIKVCGAGAIDTVSKIQLSIEKNSKTAAKVIS